MDYREVYEGVYEVFIKHCNDENLDGIIKLINSWYIDYKTIQYGLDILATKGNLEIIKYIFDYYKKSNYDESYMINIEQILLYSCRNENHNKTNLYVIKYLLEKNPEVELNYQKLFNVACGYDLNIVKYFLEIKPDIEFQMGLDNAAYNLHIYPSNFKIIKYLIGHNMSLELGYLFYALFLNISISSIEHKDFIYNKVLKYIIKIKPYLLYLLINTYNINTDGNYIKKYDKMYNDKIKLIQIKWKEILYSPYTKKGLNFIERKRDELF